MTQEPAPQDLDLSGVREAMDESDRGVGALRFAGPLEGEFRDWFWARSRLRRTLGLDVGMVLFALLALRDILVLDPAVSRWTAGIRLCLILPALAAARIACARLPRQRAERWLLAAAICGLYGLATAEFASVLLGAPLPYEGLLIVSFYLYFVIGFRLRTAAAICLPLVAIYPLIKGMSTGSSAALLIESFYLLTANGVGMVGGYVLEHYAREGFLAERLARFRADRDPLTMLPNRRVSLRHLQRVWRLAARDSAGVAVLMIDVDHFKRYNDLYGHPAGDAVLRSVAAALAGCLQRPLDLLGRYGGEEFIATAYGCTLSGARELGSRMCDAVMSAALEHCDGGPEHVVTVSVGVAWASPTLDHGLTPETLIQRADQALYRAKANGRNRVECAPPQIAVLGRTTG